MQFSVEASPTPKSLALHALPAELNMFIFESPRLGAESRLLQRVRYSSVGRGQSACDTARVRSVNLPGATPVGAAAHAVYSSEAPRKCLSIGLGETRTMVRSLVCEGRHASNPRYAQVPTVTPIADAKVRNARMQRKYWASVDGIKSFSDAS